MAKNLGPLATPNYLDPTERAFETVVFQANKPVVDGELILNADMVEEAGRNLRVATTPSGWLSKDFLKDPHVESFFTASVNPNELVLANRDALVNGWRIQVRDTGVLTTNTLDLGTPDPSPTKTTNLVILEVWRQLLSPAPDTTGKSVSGKIYRYGNVKYADDAANLTDDILNATVGSETTKRVQIQYRLRVVPNVDLVQYPDGISDPAVVANTVPPDAVTLDGTPTAFTYTNLTPTDGGLWRAGDGNPANGLGTVDGYVYAIPCCGVFRRNSTAWDRNSNQNGGVTATPGPSDRPDGLFYDIVADRDVADLRRSVTLSAFSPAELGERAYRLLLDNQMRTEFGSTQFGPTPTGGMDGHTLVWCDQIGIPGPGDGVDTGNAVPAGALVRTFDGAARRFSDRPVTETITVRIHPTDQVPPFATWVSGSTVVISLAALKVSPSTTPYSLSSYAPPNISITNIQNLRFTGNGSIPGSVSEWVPYDVVTNLGLSPAVVAVLLLGNLAAIPGLTNEPMYADLTLHYPRGNGLTHTPTEDYALDSVEINNPVAMPAEYSGTYHVGFDYAHRELDLTYTTNTIGPVSIRSKLSDAGYDRVRLPERATSLVSVTRNGAPLVGSATLSTDGREVLLDTDFITYPDTIEVSYVARRPFPQNGPQVSVFYGTRVNQAVKEADLPATLRVIPRYIASKVSVLSAGAASPYGEAYPFPQAYVQTGGLYNTSGLPAVAAEDLDSGLDLEVQGMTVANGFLELGSLIPYSPTAAIELQRVGGDDDAEGRTFYKAVASGYLPNAFAPSLGTPKKHKSFFPVLAELLEDSGIGPQGQLVLIMFYRWSEDGNVSVTFDPNQTVNTSTAAVYRVNGNPLNRGV